MNSTNITNPDSSDPWTESGAMVYVALTVATFSAVTMCCTWYAKERWMRKTTYNTVETAEENIELTAQEESSDEEIPLDSQEELYSDSKAEPDVAHDESKFTLEDEDSDSDNEAEVATAV